MAKLSILAGVTSKMVTVFVQDSSSTVGAGLTGLVYNTSSLTAYYYREGAGSAVAISLATMTLGTWATGGFVVVDGTHMPGVYSIGIPNAALASGAKSVVILLKGAANMAPVLLEIELTAVDNQNAASFGLTALPSAAPAASGGLPTCDSTNSVKIQTVAKRNTAIAGFPFLMTTSAGAAATGLTVTGQVSQNGSSFTTLTNSASITEIANGWYYVNLAAADTNAASCALRFSATGARDTDMTLLTLP